MNTLYKIIKSYFFYTLCAFGISLGIIANVGVSSYNSMNLSIAQASDIKVGTVTIIMNLAFLLVYSYLSQFKYKLKYLIQLASVLVFGLLINFFTYDVLSGINALTYIQRIMLFSGGTIIGGLSIGVIIHLNMITFPVESLCLQIAKKTNIVFVKLRYGVDVISIIISISVSLVFTLPLFVREGTIISMVLLSFSINLSKRYFENRG